MQHRAGVGLEPYGDAGATGVPPQPLLPPRRGHQAVLPGTDGAILRPDRATGAEEVRVMKLERVERSRTTARSRSSICRSPLPSPCSTAPTGTVRRASSAPSPRGSAASRHCCRRSSSGWGRRLERDTAIAGTDPRLSDYRKQAGVGASWRGYRNRPAGLARYREIVGKFADLQHGLSGFERSAPPAPCGRAIRRPELPSEQAPYPRIQRESILTGSCPSPPHRRKPSPVHEIKVSPD